MKITKENLVKLSALIKEICNYKENEWFKKSLLDSLSENELEDTMKGDLYSISEEIKYLALDEVPMIDYSGIADPAVQKQLIKDCIEMGRCRLGKFKVQQDNFNEYCRFAHYQAEELVNYFYTKKFQNSLNASVDFIQTNSKYKADKFPENIFQISYILKLMAIKNHFRLGNNIFNDLYFLNDIRNYLSHRNSFLDKQEELTLEKFSMTKMPFYLSRDKIETLEPEKKRLYNEAKKIINKQKQDFQKYFASLDEFKKFIISILPAKPQIVNTKSITN